MKLAEDGPNRHTTNPSCLLGEEDDRSNLSTKRRCVSDILVASLEASCVDIML